MNETTKEITQVRMEKALEKFLWENEDYVESRNEYHKYFGELKERLSGSKEDEAFLMKFDEVIGAYSSRYEETIYSLGFHDGLGMGMEHTEYQKGSIQEKKGCGEFTEKDMIHLIYMYDAYRELCTVLFGVVIAPELKDGVIGAFSRAFTMIEEHVPVEKRRGEYSEEDRILGDREKSPEEKAKLLLC